MRASECVAQAVRENGGLRHLLACGVEWRRSGKTPRFDLRTQRECLGVGRGSEGTWRGVVNCHVTALDYGWDATTQAPLLLRVQGCGWLHHSSTFTMASSIDTHPLAPELDCSQLNILLTGGSSGVGFEAAKVRDVCSAGQTAGVRSRTGLGGRPAPATATSAGAVRQAGPCVHSGQRL